MEQGKEHYETFLNYRRDGLPFMNLLMITPLLDSMGNVRYWLGAQIDVSGLIKDCSGLESLRRLVDEDEEEHLKSREGGGAGTDHDGAPFRYDSGVDADGTTLVGTATTSSTATRSAEKKDEFRLLAEMFSRAELETTRRFGGRHFRSQQEQGQSVDGLPNWHKPRVVLSDHYEPSPPSSPPQGFDGLTGRIGQELSDANGNITLNARKPGGRLYSLTSTSTLGLGSPLARPPTVFENYLVTRPYPSLRILFASPSLRVPGTLQTHLMARIGGSQRIHDELFHAFAQGQSVTAKVKWLPSTGLRNASTSQLVLPDHSSGSTGGTTATNASHETVGMDGRPRWIHCTPLLGANGSVGVWIIVIVDDDSGASEGTRRRVAKKNMAPVMTGGGGGSSGGNGGWQNSSAHSSARGAGGNGAVNNGTGRLGNAASDADDMSLSDYAWHRLPEDPDARKHVRDTYEETKRRERVPSALSREWERGGRNESWGGDSDRDSQRSELRAKSNNSGGGGAGAAGDGSSGYSTPIPPTGNGGSVSGSSQETEVGDRKRERSPKRSSRFGGVSVDRKNRVKSPPPDDEASVIQTAKKLGYL